MVNFIKVVLLIHLNVIWLNLVILLNAQFENWIKAHIMYLNSIINSWKRNHLARHIKTYEIIIYLNKHVIFKWL